MPRKKMGDPRGEGGGTAARREGPDAPEGAANGQTPCPQEPCEGNRERGPQKTDATAACEAAAEQHGSAAGGSESGGRPVRRRAGGVASVSHPGTSDGKENTRLEKIWSRRMALIGLKRIYEAALEGARTEVRDEDGALIEVKFNPTAANAATKAIEVANRMLGYSAPSEEEGSLSLSVELGEAEEFAT